MVINIFTKYRHFCRIQSTNTPSQVASLQEKKVIGEGHACHGPLRSITNVTYGDGLEKSIVVSVYSDDPLRLVTKAIFNDIFGEGR